MIESDVWGDSFDHGRDRAVLYAEQLDARSERGCDVHANSQTFARDRDDEKLAIGIGVQRGCERVSGNGPIREHHGPRSIIRTRL
jgi:hypothetical protein